MLLPCVITLGCGSDKVVDEYEPTEWQGSIDESLSVKMQEKQDALIRLFTAIQEVGIANYKRDCPRITFRETFDEFFGDAVDFYRWNWDGAPEKDQFPVLLVLRKDDAEFTQVEHRRIYRVTKSGGVFRIRRVEQ